MKLFLGFWQIVRGKKESRSKIVLFFIVFFLLPLVVYGINTVSTGYKHPNNGFDGRKNYDLYGNCKRVINSRANEVFIPTRTADEWNKFTIAAGNSSSVGLSNLEASICCFDNDHSACYLGDRWWHNSCDERQTTIRENCDDGCEGDSCCDFYDHSECWGGDRWWYNSCGNKQVGGTPIREDCGTVSCSGDQCCYEDQYIKCHTDGNVWNFNACDTPRSMADHCEGAGCTGVACNVVNCGGIWDDNAGTCSEPCGGGNYDREYIVSVWPKNGGIACPNPLVLDDMGNECNTQDCPTCSDGIKNQTETGVDCGGPCPACPSCSDGILNQGEEEVDCGGPCPACVPVCTFFASQACYNGDIWWYDSCGDLQARAVDCDDAGCTGGVCNVVDCAGYWSTQCWNCTIDHHIISCGSGPAFNERVKKDKCWITTTAPKNGGTSCPDPNYYYHEGDSCWPNVCGSTFGRCCYRDQTGGIIKYFCGSCDSDLSTWQYVMYYEG